MRARACERDHGGGRGRRRRSSIYRVNCSLLQTSSSSSALHGTSDIIEGYIARSIALLSRTRTHPVKPLHIDFNFSAYSAVLFSQSYKREGSGLISPVAMRNWVLFNKTVTARLTPSLSFQNFGNIRRRIRNRSKLAAPTNCKVTIGAAH